MANKLKKTKASSTAVSQRTDQIWTLARNIGNPTDMQVWMKGWAETANHIYFPERLLIFTRHTKDYLLDGTPKDYHHRFVLIVILKGTGQICVDERIFRLDVGQAFLIFPFQFHHYISLEESSIRWVFIEFEMSRTDFLESRRNQPWNFTPEFMHILHHLLEAVSSRSSTRTIKGGAEAQLWLALLLNQISGQAMKLPSTSPTILPETHKLLERINDWLARHINQSFKLDEMARGIGCSRDYLRRQFKDHFKTTLGRYVAQVRLHKAARLLRENTLNISGVAQACGYSSAVVFSRKFHATMGCSPRGYRGQLNKENTGR